MRLIDADALRKEFGYNRWYKSRTVTQIIDDAPTLEDRYDEGYAQGYIDGSTGADWSGDV